MVSPDFQAVVDAAVPRSMFARSSLPNQIANLALH
jgi:hypothetical protein